MGQRDPSLQPNKPGWQKKSLPNGVGGFDENHHPSKLLASDLQKQEATLVRHQENQILTKLVLINGFATGLAGPLMSYWFLRRFGVGAESIAPVMAATFGITGLLSLYTGGLTERIGIVSSVVWERGIAGRISWDREWGMSMMSGSKPSINSWWKWTGLMSIMRPLLSQLPIDRMCLIRRYFDLGVSTARSW